MSLTEKVIYRNNHLTPSTVSFKKVLQLSIRLCSPFLRVLWYGNQHFQLDASSSFRSQKRFLGLCVLRDVPSPRFPPAHPLEPSLGAWRPGAQRPRGSETQGIRDPGDQSQTELFACSSSREDKCISQRYRHKDTQRTLTRLAALTATAKVLP